LWFYRGGAGSRLGLFSQAGYILLGAMGLPVFQGYASGTAHIFGSTGGYLAGFMALPSSPAKSWREIAGTCLR